MTTDSERMDLIQLVLDAAESHQAENGRGTYRTVCFRIEEGRTIREELDRQIEARRV
jgi:hypothetical protein